MRSEEEIIFTENELNDILELVESRLDDGSYFGIKDYYINRLNSIKNKILDSSN